MANTDTWEVKAFVEATPISGPAWRYTPQRIENELTYPGQIRVTVIRETRAVEYAR